jgi:hypothetical protein
MSRLSGQTSVATNADILMNSPFDTRSWTPYYSGLTDGTIPQPYKGMLVSVYDDNDSNKNGLYFCTDVGGSGVITTLSTTWEKLGSGSGTLTGGTVTSDNKISGATISGYTIYFGQVNAVTGGTYSDGTISLSGSGSLGTITGFNVLSGTGVDYSYVNDSNNYGLKIDATNQQISFKLNNGTILSAYTGSLKDFYITAGTYNNTSGVITFYNTSGGSFPVSGFTTGNDNYYTTGSTYTPTNGIITFNRTDLQSAYSATGFNYVTGFTVNNNTISGYTNISGGTVAYGGTINAVTGGSFSNNVLYLSGTGNILSGVSITGFSTNVGGSIYTGGTSTAGTGGTTNITGTLIESGKTTGVTFSLSGALSFNNTNLTKREIGGIGNSSNFFQNGKTLQEIIQQIFYPVDAPTIVDINKTLIKAGLTNDLYVVGTVGPVSLTATYTSGTSVAGIYTKTTGPVTSFVFSGYTSPIPAVTSYTSSNASAYIVNSNYNVVKGYNTWTCNINYNTGQQPVYDDGTPYYGTGVGQFISPGTVTPSSVRIEGVYPVSATTTTGNLSIFSQQTLVSMLSNSTLVITLAGENNISYRQSFILPSDLDSRFTSLGLFNSLTNNYDIVTILSLFDKTTYGPIVIGGTSVTYYKYTYKIPDLTGQSIYKLTFSS